MNMRYVTPELISLQNLYHSRTYITPEPLLCKIDCKYITNLIIDVRFVSKTYFTRTTPV